MKFKHIPAGDASAAAPAQQPQQPQDPRVGGRFQRMPDGNLQPLDAPAPDPTPAGDTRPATSTTSSSE